jgi:hypothetical protein
MDILKNIQQAEKQAAEIEKKHQFEAETLLASVSAEVLRVRAEREERIEREIKSLRVEREKKLEAEKASIADRSSSQRDELKRKAGANAKKAVDAFLKRLGL